MFFKFIQISTEELFDDEISRVFADLNIDFPERFVNAKIITEVIQNRLNISDCSDPRPMALLFFPKIDWMPSIIDVQNQITSLINAGYRVLYFEPADLESFCKNFRQLPGRNLIDLLIIGSKGYTNKMIFAETGTFGLQEKGIDRLDEEMIKNKNISNYLAEQSTIILQSCFAGYTFEGDKEKEYTNMANVFTRIFPQSQVYAPEVGIYALEYTWQNNLVTGARFTCKTYVSRKDKEPELLPLVNIRAAL